ncbi:MAG TPA: glycosyltransferase [Candidatus Paceibacterota bacterium]|nr:glycosyltransferase [Candidatus Paceibacterota bacterium]
MGGNPLTYAFYPILFLALFYETFLLLTFLSRPAKRSRARARALHTPRVALIVPCYNEEKTLAKTAESVLALDYPADKLRLILVNDGSTDGTAKAMEAFAGNPRVTLIHQENGGKHIALNVGIGAASDAEFVGCVDADSYLAPDALKRTLACFTDEKIAAAFSSIIIGEPRGMLEHMQGAEYLMGSYFRHALASINAFFVTPGPFSVYRRAVLDEIGGFRYGQQTEDMEMAMRLLRHGYAIENAPAAIVVTKAQDTLQKLVRQRMRWASGYLRNVWFDYRDLLSRKHGFLGLFVLPMGILTPFFMVATLMLSVYLSASGIVRYVAAHEGVPLAWSVSRASRFSLDWFYLPTDVLTLLTALIIGLGVLSAFLGKCISGTKERAVPSIIAYSLLYGFVAPVWYLRSLIDVSTGTRRGWRD